MKRLEAMCRSAAGLAALSLLAPLGHAATERLIDPNVGEEWSYEQPDLAPGSLSWTEPSANTQPLVNMDGVISSTFDGPTSLPYGDTASLMAVLDDAEPAAAGSAAAAEPKQGAAEADGPTKGTNNDLANQLQNPLAALISVPFQFNWDTGFGPNDDKDKITLNIQPVIPINLNDDWNLISRTIIPVVYAEGPARGIDSAFGLGDTLQSLFFSPVKPANGWIWGVGPAFLIPTGTSDLFRSKQFSMGPTVVALRQDHVGGGTLTWGMLANHVWRVAGSDDVADVNSTFLQPFISFTTKTGATFGLNTESTYNWTSEEWNVPIHLFFRQMMKFGNRPVQLEFGGQWYADSPEGGAEWGIRTAFTLLFPR